MKKFFLILASIFVLLGFAACNVTQNHEDGEGQSSEPASSLPSVTVNGDYFAVSAKAAGAVSYEYSAYLWLADDGYYAITVCEGLDENKIVYSETGPYSYEENVINFGEFGVRTGTLEKNTVIVTLKINSVDVLFTFISEKMQGDFENGNFKLKTLGTAFELNVSGETPYRLTGALTGNGLMPIEINGLKIINAAPIPLEITENGLKGVFELDYGAGQGEEINLIKQ